VVTAAMARMGDPVNPSHPQPMGRRARVADLVGITEQIRVKTVRPAILGNPVKTARLLAMADPSSYFCRK
jgi:hypothetical protein